MTPQTIEQLVNSSDETAAQDLAANYAAGRRRERKWNRNPAAAKPGQARARWNRSGLLGPRRTDDVSHHRRGDGRRLLHGGDFCCAGRRHAAAHPPPRGRIVPPPRRHADDSGGRGYNHCIAWRFCLSSPRNRSFLQEHRRRIAKALVLITPAGLEGFFAEVFEPAVDRSATPPPASKELIGRALAAAPRYGLELLPPA